MYFVYLQQHVTSSVDVRFSFSPIIQFIVSQASHFSSLLCQTMELKLAVNINLFIVIGVSTVIIIS